MRQDGALANIALPTRRSRRSLRPPVISLINANYLAVLVQKLPVPRNETPCLCTRSGGRSIASCDLRGGPAPRRRPVGAAPVAPAGGSRKLLAKAIFCAMFVLSGRPMGERHEQQTSSFERPASRSPHPVRRGVRTRASFCSNHLKTLKTAMGRSCNKLA